MALLLANVQIISIKFSESNHGQKSGNAINCHIIIIIIIIIVIIIIIIIMIVIIIIIIIIIFITTGELGYDGLNGTRKIGPSYAKSVIYV